MNSFRSGMQVHAVPDDERALDSNGKPLPWAYSYADSGSGPNRKPPADRGPFGRPTSRRAASRTKTATPGAREDPVTIENMQTFDAIFGRHRQEQEEKESKAPRERPLASSSRPPHAQAVTEATQPSTTSTPGLPAATFKEPTEVLLYGYGLNHEGIVISHMEELSGGHIYEDYDRAREHSRYARIFANNIRASIPRSLPRDAIKRIYTYQGGDHWIKVTFDSPEAAERVTFSSPIGISGHLVYAEQWRGVGQNPDVAIPLSSAEPATTNAFRQRRPATNEQPRTVPSRVHATPTHGSLIANNNDSPDSTETISTGTVPGSVTGTDVQATESQSEPTSAPVASTLKPLRIKGATRVTLKPASEALLPVAPWSQRAFGHIPLFGSLVGGDPNNKPGQGGGIIGSAVPRKEDGSFDWQSASLYWRICWSVDSWLGTDLCGMKGED